MIGICPDMFKQLESMRISEVLMEFIKNYKKL